jgi:hypothetical protein
MKDFSMTKRSTSADFVTAFATGWPENQPDIMVLSLTTHRGVQDFALTEQQALLVAKTIKETAANWPNEVVEAATLSASDGTAKWTHS